MSDQPDHLSEPELRKLFSESGYLETPDDALIRELADASEVIHVRGGDRVIRGGLPLESLYTVVYGRLRNVVADAEGEGRHVNELGRGANPGLGNLLTGRPYLTDVYAVRDSILLRTSKNDFERIIADHPDFMIRILKKLTTRFEDFIGTQLLETGALPEVERVETNLAFIPVDGSNAMRESADMSWKSIGDRLNPFTESKPAPNILDVLQRTAMINSSRNARIALASNQADLLLTPPLEEFGLLDWTAHDALYEAGYRYASEMLSQWKFEPKS